jgi:hypothetical protein
MKKLLEDFYKEYGSTVRLLLMILLASAAFAILNWLNNMNWGK